MASSSAMWFARAALCVLAAILVTTILAGSTAWADDMEVDWKNALNFKSDSASAKVGGRIQYDTTWITNDDDLDARGISTEDGAEFRRARIYIQGNLKSGIEWKAQYDFAAGDIGFRDMYIGLTRIPVVGTFRIGQLKEPFGLETLTSSNAISFMERSPAVLFNPDRQAGWTLVNSFTSQQRITSSLGLYRATDPTGNGRSEGNYNVTFRITGLAWAGGNQDVLHLGVGLSSRNPVDDTVSYETRPSSHLTDSMIETGDIATGHNFLYNFEAAFTKGPISIQGEYTLNSIDSQDYGTLGFSSWYGYASWMITGEQRGYDRKYGSFKNPKPKKDFREGGAGAFELRARYSFVDLIDGEFTPTTNANADELTDFVGGVTWYLNGNTRVMADFVHAENKEEPGTFQAFQMRFQIAY